MNNRFFTNLKEEIKLKRIKANIYNIIDWLFDDEKFDNKYWNKKKLAQFTKMIKKKYMNDKNYQYGPIKSLKFPKRKKIFYIVISKGNSEIKDITRHIRNGIAHNHTTIKNISSNVYFEIKDFSYNRQTSQMLITYDFLNDLYIIYNEIKVNKSI